LRGLTGRAQGVLPLSVVMLIRPFARRRHDPVAEAASPPSRPPRPGTGPPTPRSAGTG